MFPDFEGGWHGRTIRRTPAIQYLFESDSVSRAKSGRPGCIEFVRTANRLLSSVVHPLGHKGHIGSVSSQSPGGSRYAIVDEERGSQV